MPPLVDVVVPTIGRGSLGPLAARLAAIDDPRLGRVVVVDDRAGDCGSLDVPGALVVRSGGRGPAAARNAGWRRCSAPWVCFVDDDVVLDAAWFPDLVRDLHAAGEQVGAVQGRVHVPLPTDRRPTDRERGVAGLEGAAWITADLAVRRGALLTVGGFDERFPRAYREDADLALRLLDHGWQLAHGARRIAHPVTPAPTWWCVRAQRGNADDALMDRLHGPGWRARVDAPRGALRQHLLTTAIGVAALAAACSRRSRPVGVAAGAWWAARTARWSWARIAPGPRSPAETWRMLVTSVAIPPVATAWAIAGRRRATRLAPGGAADRWRPRPPALVLFDRDGTLVVDEPYNGDPAAVRPMPGAAAALGLLRRRGIATGIVTNQSGIARGLISVDQVADVNGEVERQLGPFQHIAVCPHDANDGCACRKPAPGMVLAAARALQIEPERCALIGDIATDVDAGISAGARAILVPNPQTAPADIARSPEVVGGLVEAVLRLIGPGGTPQQVRA